MYARQIEYIHDGTTLPFRRRIKVVNVSKAYEYLLTACMERHARGLRVRIEANAPTGELFLATRNSMAMTTALALLPQSFRR